MVCVNQEELGGPISSAGSQSIDLDADIVFVAFPQVLKLGQCPK